VDRSGFRDSVREFFAGVRGDGGSRDHARAIVTVRRGTWRASSVPASQALIGVQLLGEIPVYETGVDPGP